MRILSIIITFCLLFCTIATFAQKGPLKKAQQLYKEKKYATAIPLYKKALEERYTVGVASKLAYCYKMNNKTIVAEELYAKIVTHEKARDITYFYYGEALMSNGKCEEAKKWFAAYLLENPGDEASQSHIKACDYSKEIPIYFEHIIIEPFSQNSEVDDNSPVFWNNGIVYTSDRKGRAKFLDEKSGWTGRDYLRLYYSKRKEDGAFESSSPFVPKLNVARKNTGMATFTADGTVLYFSRNGNTMSKQNAYCLQLYGARSKDGKKWKDAKVLDFCRKETNYMHPAVSPDGRYLFFVSDKTGGNGGTDIYVSEKKKKGWTMPENLGTTINTESHEGFPFMHANGKLYFCSKGHPGFGGFDIFVTEKDEQGNWKNPTNLGLPINSPSDDISIAIDATERNGFFTSSRDGGDDDIYILTFSPNSVVQNIPLPLELEMPTKMEELAEMVDDTATAIAESIGLHGEEVFGNHFLLLPQLLQKEELAIGQSFLLPNLQFEETGFMVTEAHTSELAQLAIILKEHPSLQIEIGSHDAGKEGQETGQLTTNRAAAIISYLTVLGIERTRLSSRAYGNTSPLINCAEQPCSEEQIQKNTRVEVKVVGY